MSELQKKYKENIKDELSTKLQIKNPMQIPELKKIVLNIGIGNAARDKNVLPKVTGELALIAGQKPIVTKARKSIAGFGIREGWPIGCKVTLRGKRMYQFFERFVTVAIPRIRDFRGFSSKSFDGRGNLNISIKEQIIFPEIDYDKVASLYGINVCITTSVTSDESAKELISSLGFPFKN